MVVNASRRWASLAAGSMLLLTAVLAGCGSVASAPTLAAPTSAPTRVSAKQYFPNGITLLVGYGPGGTVDTAARVLQPYLRNALGVPVVVQDMPGGGGNTAAQYEGRVESHASTFLMAFLPAITLGQVVGHGDYDLTKMTPLYGIYGNNTAVLIARTGSPYDSFRALQHATAPLTVGVAGVRSSAAWLALAYLARYNHIRVTPVPFKGGAAATEAALGGSVNLASTTTVEAERLIGAKKAVGVVEFAPQRYSFLPGVPSIAQVGSSKESFTSIIGLVGPEGMPADEARILDQALKKAVANPSFATRARRVGLEVSPLTPKAWKAAIDQSLSAIERDGAFLSQF